MKRHLIAFALLLALAGAAHAFGLGLGNRFGKLGAIYSGPSGSGGGCAGVIDASVGCPLPMLGS